jgi:hypothetical protein
MATFTVAENQDGISVFRFRFVNHTKHHPIHYELGPATGGNHKQHGTVKAGEQDGTGNFLYGGTLEKGNVHVVKLHGAPDLGFRFWSGSDGQYINANGGNGYTVTKDSSEISEVTGHGFRVTVDGGGVDNPTTADIYIQVYHHG